MAQTNPGEINLSPSCAAGSLVSILPWRGSSSPPRNVLLANIARHRRFGCGRHKNGRKFVTVSGCNGLLGDGSFSDSNRASGTRLSNGDGLEGHRPNLSIPDPALPPIG